jgi:hypothetical protein
MEFADISLIDREDWLLLAEPAADSHVASTSEAVHRLFRRH